MSASTILAALSGALGTMLSACLDVCLASRICAISDWRTASLARWLRSCRFSSSYSELSTRAGVSCRSIQAAARQRPNVATEQDRPCAASACTTARSVGLGWASHARRASVIVARAVSVRLMLSHRRQRLLAKLRANNGTEFCTMVHSFVQWYRRRQSDDPFLAPLLMYGPRAVSARLMLSHLVSSKAEIAIGPLRTRQISSK